MTTLDWFLISFMSNSATPRSNLETFSDFSAWHDN